jgi:thiamine biosynthesis lipoprotein
MQSATVLVPPGPHAGILSDMASKPFFMASPEHRTQMKVNTGIRRILLIDGAGKVWVTPEMRILLKRDAQKTDGTF